MQENIDIMKEIGTIAAAHGSRALSEMLDKRIDLTLPSAEVMNMGKPGSTAKLDQTAFTVQGKVLSAFHATIILAFDERSARGLLDICCPGSVDSLGNLNEIGLSALNEIGNVVMGAFVGAISVILREPIIPSIPSFAKGILGDILDSTVTVYNGEKYVVFIEACFEEREKKVRGGLYFVVPPQTLDKICGACAKLLEDI